jgi:GT2 family glycosyltransferase
MMGCVDIVIVNWNAGHQLRECLISLPKESGSPVAQICIVDNASTDQSLEDLPETVTLVRLLENKGFATAANEGARHGKAPFLLFLNPDAIVYPDTLSEAVRYLTASENSGVGVLGVALEDETGHVARSCARFPTPLRFWAVLMGLHRVFPRWGAGVIMTDWNHETTRDVDHVIGAFYLIRRSVFETLTGFDERFFVYLEDLDLSLRVRAAGWDIRYLAELRAFHRGGGTSRQALGFRLFLSLKSRIDYAFKNFSRFAAIIHLFGTLTIEPIARVFFSLLSRRPGDLRDLYQAYGFLIKDLLKPWLGARV